MLVGASLQLKLRECEEVLENDYFLAALKDEFVENARLFIFETYCRIHQCIDLRMLAGVAAGGFVWGTPGRVVALHAVLSAQCPPLAPTPQPCRLEQVLAGMRSMTGAYCCDFPGLGILFAGKLNMDEEAAEKWIVNLIRHARLNAKIDSQAGTVVMGMQFPSAYEQVMEKAKGLSQRTFVLANLVVGAPQT